MESEIIQVVVFLIIIIPVIIWVLKCNIKEDRKYKEYLKQRDSPIVYTPQKREKICDGCGGFEITHDYYGYNVCSTDCIDMVSETFE